MYHLFLNCHVHSNPNNIVYHQITIECVLIHIVLLDYSLILLIYNLIPISIPIPIPISIPLHNVLFLIVPCDFYHSFRLCCLWWSDWNSNYIQSGLHSHLSIELLLHIHILIIWIYYFHFLITSHLPINREWIYDHFWLFWLFNYPN